LGRHATQEGSNAEVGIMTPSMFSLLQRANIPTIRETGRLMLVLASFLEAAGRRQDALVTAEDALVLLDEAARLARRRAAQ
jgi:hypothetical protein